MHLDDRQQTERDFFNTIVQEKWDNRSLVVQQEAPSFADYNGDLFHAWRSQLGDLRGKRVLELGCGSGELSVWMALQGAIVTGCDISDESIRVAERRAKENHISSFTTFFAIGGESLPFDDASFDVVVICVALHHMDVPVTVQEMYRVLKLGGVFAAIEPYIFSERLQRIRSSKLISRVFPERRETPTERMLDSGDADLLGKVFGNGVVIPRRCFSALIVKFPFVLSTVGRLHAKNAEGAKQRFVRAVQRVDTWLFETIPALRPLARYAILVAHKA